MTEARDAWHELGRVLLRNLETNWPQWIVMASLLLFGLIAIWLLIPA